MHASSGGTGPCFLNKQDPSAPEPLWYTNASSGHLCAHRGSNGTVRFEIHQDGTHIQCGLEFDSFIEEDTPIYAAVPVGIHPSPPLRNLTHITVGFTAELLGGPDVQPRCGSEPQCQGSGKIDYGYAGETVGMTEEIVAPHWFVGNDNILYLRARKDLFMKCKRSDRLFNFSCYFARSFSL